VLEHVHVEINALSYMDGHGRGRTDVQLRIRIDSPLIEVPHDERFNGNWGWKASGVSWKK